VTVETRQKAINILTSAATLGIYTPVTVIVRGTLEATGADPPSDDQSSSTETNVEMESLQAQRVQPPAAARGSLAYWKAVAKVTPIWAWILAIIALIVHILLIFAAFDDMEPGWGGWGIFSVVVLIAFMFAYAFWWPGSTLFLILFCVGAGLHALFLGVGMSS